MLVGAMLRGLGAFIKPIRQNPQIGVMLLIVTLVMSGVGLVAPILSLYAKAFATSSTLAGMVITIFGVGRFVANYPAGALSQRYGRRQLLGTGLAVVAVGSVGAAIPPSIEWLVLWRFVQGVGSGIYMTVSVAAMADLARKNDRGNVIALQQAAMWLGAGLGPGIGGVLAEHFGLAAPFWAYAIVITAAMALVWIYLDETADREDLHVPMATSAEPQQGLWSQPLFGSLCLLYLGTFFTRTASQWMLIPMLAIERYHMGVDTIGLAQTGLAIGSFALLPASGNIINRFGARRLTVFSVIITAVALVLLALGNSTSLFWIGLAVLGVGIGVSSPSTSVLSVEIVPRAHYGPGMGILRSFGDAGYMLGPVVVGMLDDLGSVGVIGGLVANALLLVIFVGIFRVRQNRT